MKLFISFFLFFFVATLTYSQNNITNTLGTGGTFTIKDGSTTFFTLSQSDGRITLPLTTSASPHGVIFKGASSFIHDFRPTGTPGYNTFIGSGAGNFTMSHTTGDQASYNTGVGAGSLLSLTTGYSNTALGYSSLVSNTSGYQNTSLGTNSLIANTIGFNNTASGYNSLYWNSTGNSNSAFGDYSLYNNTTGTSNTAVGHESLAENTTGTSNTAVGSAALTFNITGSENTAFGYHSLLHNFSGFQNTAVGHHSLENNNGNYNTALGYNAGSTVSTGLNLTLIGIDANPSSPTALDQITLGNGFVSSLRCNVQNISSLSDARDKKNIKELNLGIDFLMKIKPRLFNWDKREWYDDNKSDGSKMKEEPTAGFIAQEFDEVQAMENAEWLNLVLKDNPEKLEATPGNLLPIMVKAIQDLKKENDVLKAKLTKFEQAQNILVTEIENLKTNDSETSKVSLGDQ
ncbi:MAG: tail fiber domain-containing protein [Ignavibacteria bacterium]|nr:tail fiber domain-containing protein [Ignavibacteria bacterium]